MPRRRPRTQRKARADLAGWMIIAGVVLVLGLVTSVWLEQRKTNPDLDRATLCPAQGPASVTVVLIDATDDLSAPQARDFQNQLERLRAEIPRHGLLEVFLVRDTGDGLLQPTLSLCNPGRGSDVNEFVGNPQRTEARWRSAFQTPLDEAFQLAVSPSAASRSPILESIQSVALTALQPAERIGLARKLIVVSDLVQHTEAISFYRGLPEPGALEASPAFRQARTDLRGIDVELWMLQRPALSVRTQAALAQLWEGLIREQGGRVVRIYNVSG